VLAFALASPAGIAIAAGDESQNKVAPAGETSTVPVVEQAGPPPSPASVEAPPPSTVPAPAPGTQQGMTPQSEAADDAPRASPGPLASASDVFGPDKPSDAVASERGHLGLVLGTAKGLGLGGPKFAYGLRGGIRISHIEIGFLVGSSGKFGEESGNESGDLAAYPILFPLNGIINVTSILSWVLGGQVGLMHYRKHVFMYWQTGPGSSYSTVDGDATTNVFAYGFQTGPAVRLAAHVSLRFEFSLTHVGNAFVTVTNKYPDGSSTEAGVGIDAHTFLNLYGALCLTL